MKSNCYTLVYSFLPKQLLDIRCDCIYKTMRSCLIHRDEWSTNDVKVSIVSKGIWMLELPPMTSSKTCSIYVVQDGEFLKEIIY